MRRRQTDLQARKTPTTRARTEFAARIVARSGTDKQSAQRRTRGSRQHRESKDWPPAYVQCKQNKSAAAARWRRARGTGARSIQKTKQKATVSASGPGGWRTPSE